MGQYTQTVAIQAPKINVQQLIQTLPKIEPIEITFDNSVDTFA